MTEQAENKTLHVSSGLDELKRLNRRLTALGALLHDETVLSMPEWVQFQTTYSCNLECPHCATHGTEELRQEYNRAHRGIDRKLLSSVAARALPAADEVVLSISGEPLATPGLENLFDEIAPYGAKLHLITNGTTLGPKRLSHLLPVAGNINLSLDGATPRVLETTRQGARWDAVLSKVRLLMRAIELLPEGAYRPHVRIAATAMASNLRDLPSLVRLAAFLGISQVAAGPIIIHFDHLADEVLDRHQALYNACHADAHAVARELGVDLLLPPPFAGVAPDPTAIPRGENLMIRDLPEDYYETLPPFESAIDPVTIEEQAQQTVQLIAERASSASCRRDEIESVVGRLAETGQAMLTTALHRSRDELARLRASPDETVKFCTYLHRRTYVDENGAVAPCCIVGRPSLGHVDDTTSLAEVWNGPAYQEFRRRFYSTDPVDCCKGCEHVVHMPRRALLARVDGTSEIGEV